MRILSLFMSQTPGGCSIKKLFFKISQNSWENTCARVSFIIKLLAPKCDFNKVIFLRTPFSYNTSDGCFSIATSVLLIALNCDLTTVSPFLQSWIEYLAKIKEIKHSWTRLKYFYICFCQIYDPTPFLIPFNCVSTQF